MHYDGIMMAFSPLYDDISPDVLNYKPSQIFF